jgi:hypothetical protein
MAKANMEENEAIWAAEAKKIEVGSVIELCRVEGLMEIDHPDALPDRTSVHSMVQRWRWRRM